MATKMLKLVHSCGECPNRRYDSGNVYECVLTGLPIRDAAVVAAACPLPDYPAQRLADQEMTILALQRPQQYNFSVYVITYLAARLKATINASDASLDIPLGRERSVRVRRDSIRRITTHPSCMVEFVHEDIEFRLYPEADRPFIEEMSAERTKGNLWITHYL